MGDSDKARLHLSRIAGASKKDIECGESIILSVSHTAPVFPLCVYAPVVLNFPFRIRFHCSKVMLSRSCRRMEGIVLLAFLSPSLFEQAQHCWSLLQNATLHVLIQFSSASSKVRFSLFAQLRTEISIVASVCLWGSFAFLKNETRTALHDVC